MVTQRITAASRPLTATQAVAAAPSAIADLDTVKLVQASLLRKGYVDGGPADGDLGQQTADSILSFRARNDLPLTPTIDQDFLRALAVALPKRVDIMQETATVKEIAPKVEAVKTNIAVQDVTWWSKLSAWLLGLPSISFSLVAAIVDNLDDAATMLTPVRSFLSELPFKYWLFGFAGVAFVMGYQAYRISKLTQETQSALVAGYKIGTVKNDAPSPPMPPHGSVVE